MRHISKSTVITFILLIILITESIIVGYDLLHPNKDVFSLDAKEYDVPIREVKVLPFMFETDAVQKFDDILDDFANEVSVNLMTKITNSKDEVINEPVATEIAPEDEDEQDILNENVKTSNIENIKMINNIGDDSLIAIVVDDMGVSVPHTKDIIDLNSPMTASFLTYGSANKEQVMDAKNAGFEVMLHVPMMPHIKKDLAPITLSSDMSDEDIKFNLQNMISRYDGLGMEGVNNHMGSLFTENKSALGIVMSVLKEKNLYFLDSKTTSKSVGKEMAHEYGVKYIARDVFLDNKNDYDYIIKQLNLTEKIAKKRGYAVAICHPRSQTYRALKDWLQTIKEKNIKLVHLKDLVDILN